MMNPSQSPKLSQTLRWLTETELSTWDFLDLKQDLIMMCPDPETTERMSRIMTLLRPLITMENSDG
jgi:hypothetical protein